MSAADKPKFLKMPRKPTKMLAMATKPNASGKISRARKAVTTKRSVMRENCSENDQKTARVNVVVFSKSNNSVVVASYKK